MSNIILFTFTYVKPSDYLGYPNVYTFHDWTDDIDMDSLNMFFIQDIAILIHEFCDKDIGHNIHVTSYDDFCSEYWKRQDGPIIEDYYHLYEFNYYDPNATDGDYWKLWHPRDHKDEIMKVYNEMFVSKNK